MKKTLLSALVATAAMAALQPAAAAPIFKLGGDPAGTTGLNDIELVNRENLYRSQAACDAAPGTCLAHDSSNDPTGYSRTNAFLPNNVQVGDLFAGVYNLRTISNIDTGVTWSADQTPPGLDTFTGYFVQEVQDVAAIGGLVSRVLLRTPTVADPFGVVDTAAGESAALYVDVTTPWKPDGALTTTFNSVTSVTDGLLWATLGIGLGAAPGTALAPGFDGDGYAYSEVNIGGGLATFSGNFFTAYNVLSTGAGFNVGDLLPINDPGEITVGGILPGDPLNIIGSTAANNTLGLCTPTATYACNDITGNGQLTPNQNVSPWLFASEDPMQLYAVPEPASLILLGIGLVGMGMTTARRRRLD